MRSRSAVWAASLRCATALASAVALLSAAPALADEAANKACGASFEKSQYLRKDLKLKAAREQASQCARDVCPSFIRDECTKIVADVDAAQPTLVFAVRDAAGADLADVRVEVDGVLLTEHLAGAAFAVDPGAHTLHFTRGGQTVEEHVIVSLAEKNRVLDVRFPAASASAALPSTSGPVERTSSPGVLWPGLVVSGVALAAIGTSIGLGLDAKGTADNLRSTCAPRCAHGDVSAVNTELIVSDVVLGVGIVAAGFATWLLIVRPGRHEVASPVAFSVSPTWGGAAATMRVRF